jgi:hypothetical protein
VPMGPFSIPYGQLSSPPPDATLTVLRKMRAPGEG